MDYQSKGKTAECNQYVLMAWATWLVICIAIVFIHWLIDLYFHRYQQILHRNLVYLATIADSNQNMQSLLPAVCLRLYLIGYHAHTTEPPVGLSHSFLFFSFLFNSFLSLCRIKMTHFESTLFLCGYNFNNTRALLLFLQLFLQLFSYLPFPPTSSITSFSLLTLIWIWAQVEWDRVEGGSLFTLSRI